MCGIAGVSVAPGVEIDATATARLLLAGLAERGQDATGYAFHGPDGLVEVHKESVPLASFIERLTLPDGVRSTVMHVRDFTKGRPGINDNNHPIRYGRVVGVHNGHLINDDELFEAHRMPRSTPDITVDSEAIMMLADHLGDLPAALEQVRGSAAVALLHDGDPGRLQLAKRASRTLHVAHGGGLALFASTREPLELARKALGWRMRVDEIGEGTSLELRDGEIVGRRRFHVDSRYVGRRNVSYPDLPEKRTLVRLALAAFL
jgi:glucosamine--fructose-6-phosphate aminotransferase (isomerizing)